MPLQIQKHERRKQNLKDNPKSTKKVLEGGEAPTMLKHVCTFTHAQNSALYALLTHGGACLSRAIVEDNPWEDGNVSYLLRGAAMWVGI